MSQFRFGPGNRHLMSVFDRRRQDRDGFVGIQIWFNASAEMNARAAARCHAAEVIALETHEAIDLRDRLTKLIDARQAPARQA